MRLLVTAGPTREPIDPVRFLSNRSSGKMGYAVARAARSRGHDVVLVSGPVDLAEPEGMRVVQVTTAADMLAAVEGELAAADALVMTAAVADWRPAQQSGQKLKKGGDRLTVAFEPTADILATIAPRKDQRVFVGFAAETENLLEEGRRKLVAKGLDMIVANDVSRDDAGFGVDTNAVTLITPDAAPRELPLMPKDDVAGEILGWLEQQVPSA